MAPILPVTQQMLYERQKLTEAMNFLIRALLLLQNKVMEHKIANLKVVQGGAKDLALKIKEAHVCYRGYQNGSYRGQLTRQPNRS